MNKLFTILLLCLTVSSNAQLTKVGDVDTYVHDPKVKAPVVLFHHGNGEAANNGGASALLKNGLPQLLHNGFKPPFPVYIFCPQDGWGTFSPSRLPQLIADIKSKYPLADFTNITITGLSAGGVTAFNSIAYIKPTRVIPMSSAGNDNSLVNLYAQLKIPIHFYVGENEASYKSISEWTQYLLKQAGANSTLTIRKGVGHCCWNDIYQSAEFWNLIKPVLPKKDTTLNRLGSFDLPAGTWTVLAKTESVKLWELKGTRLTTMEAGTWLLSNGQIEYTVTFVKPAPIAPVLCYTIRIGNTTYSLYSHPDRNIYKFDNRSASPLDFEMKCGDKILTLKKDYTWTQK